MAAVGGVEYLRSLHETRVRWGAEQSGSGSDTRLCPAGREVPGGQGLEGPSHPRRASQAGDLRAAST